MAKQRKNKKRMSRGLLARGLGAYIMTGGALQAGVHHRIFKQKHTRPVSVRAIKDAPGKLGKIKEAWKQTKGLAHNPSIYRHIMPDIQTFYKASHELNDLVPPSRQSVIKTVFGQVRKFKRTGATAAAAPIALGAGLFAYGQRKANLRKKALKGSSKKR